MTDIVEYSLGLRELHLFTYRNLRSIIPIPGRPAKLIIATSEREYQEKSKGSPVVAGAAAFTIPGRDTIVLNGPRMMRLQRQGTYSPCCAITHEYIHIGMYYADDECHAAVLRECRRVKHDVIDAVRALGWSTRRVDELITTCCEWVYCHHPHRRTRSAMAVTTFGTSFIDLLGWLHPGEA